MKISNGEGDNVIIEFTDMEAYFIFTMLKYWKGSVDLKTWTELLRLIKIYEEFDGEEIDNKETENESDK